MPETIDSLLDRHVSAYELALRLGAADLAAYLPARQSPVYADVLVELIRVEIEWSWRQGAPKDIEDYRSRFPEVFESAKYRDAVVAEEARQRRQFTPEIGAGTHPINPAPADVLATRAVEGLYRQEKAPLAPRESSESGPRFPNLGEVFLDFRLVAELGRGAFGRVFLAHQGGLAERPVALKIAVDLHQESNTLARLQHTNIVPIYSVHRAGELHAVCMPYFGGTTLSDIYRDLLLQKKVPQSGQALVSTWRERRTRSTTTASGPEATATPPEAHGVETAFHKMARLSYGDAVLWLASHLADGLAHAHDRGILHRDLKPANILLTDDGEPMLLDFNLASDQKMDATLARVGGTLQYMSPEQIEAFTGQPVSLTPASDLYALGIILFEMLTGSPPFPAHRNLGVRELIILMKEDRRAAAPSPRRLNRAVSPAVDAIVRRCLEPDPTRRYQSARDLGEDLRRQLRNQPLKHTPEPSLRERIEKFRRRHPRLLSLTTCVAAVVLAGLILGLAAYWRGERVANLEAGEAARGLGEDRRELEFLLTAHSAPTLVDRALDRGRSALARFKEGDGRLGRLPEGEREQAHDNLRDVLWLCAQAHLLRVNPAHPAETAADLDRAEELLREALRQCEPAAIPRSLRVQQARLARLRGHDKEADDLERQALALEPRTARDWYRVAFGLAEQGRFRQALGDLGASLDRDPGAFNPWFLRGLCCDELGQDTESVRCYTVCIALRPTLYAPYLNRGLAWTRQRRFELARKDFSEVIRLEPNHADAYFNRALTFLATTDLAAAEADATQALALGSEHTRLYLVRARIRARRNDAEGARKDREEGLRRQPHDASDWVSRGLARLPREPQAALADFDAALRQEPRSLAALQNRAHVLAKYLHRPDDAIRSLDEAVALSPEDARPRAGRGVLRGRLGRDAGAIADAEAALALDDLPPNQYQVAGIYALVSRRDPGSRDTAFRLLTAALKRGFGGEFLAGDPDLDPIRADPRFAQVQALAGR